jgi:hypothetical protein
LLAETPEQKAKRLKAEAKAERASYTYSQRYWDRADRRAERADRRAERAEAKLNSHAYQSGKRTGDAIGLDSQLKAGQKQSTLA